MVLKSVKKLTITEAKQIIAISSNERLSTPERESKIIEAFIGDSEIKQDSFSKETRRSILKQVLEAIKIGKITPARNVYLETSESLYELELSASTLAKGPDIATLVEGEFAPLIQSMEKVLSLFVVKVRKLLHSGPWERVQDKDREQIAEDLKNAKWRPAVEALKYIRENCLSLSPVTPDGLLNPQLYNL